MDSTQETDASLSPFSCRYTPNVPELLNKLQISLVISTYQAGKVVFLSPVDDEKIIQLPRTLQKPMGIGIRDNDHLAVACLNEVITFKNSADLARTYPKSPGKYDALYMPRTTFHTGPLDIHDLEWTDKGLFGVNTLFSCVARISDDFNFEPYWMPPFIDKLVSEDRCHLNGMIMNNGLPAWATAFNRGNTMRSWREEVTDGGVLMEIPSGEIMATRLAMPHSPRLYDGRIYVLLSATGGLATVDMANGKVEEITRIKGFVRGMAKHGDFVFIGRSKLRKNSSTFAKLEIAKFSDISGITIVHLPTSAIVGEINYQMSVDEIYDVKVLPGKLRPNLMNTLTDDRNRALHTPQATYWAADKPN